MSSREAVHLFVQDEALVPRVVAIVESLGEAAPCDVVVHKAAGQGLSAAMAAREELGSAPIGFLVGSRGAVLDALAGGADEVEVLERLDADRLLAFLERLDVRVRHRRDHDRVTESAAQADKLAALGTLVAGIGHEINNPLSAISLSIEAAKRALGPLFDVGLALDAAALRKAPMAADEVERLAASIRRGRKALDADRLLEDMSTATAHIADIVADLRVYARSDSDERPTIVDVADVVDQCVRLVGREVTRNGVIERDFPDDLPPLVVPRSRLTQVVTNLLVNAAHAIREVERPIHRVRIRARADDRFVAISISDTGPGIASETLERIFDPFFTTKPKELGSGLGLSISRAILRKLGGDLLVDSVVGEGANFVCLVPVPAQDVVREAYLKSAPRGTIVAKATPLVVLVVDEDERVLRAMSRFLGARYRMMLARDGREAIDLLVSGAHVDVVLTEIALPEVDGFGVLDWIGANRPGLAQSTFVVTASHEEPRVREELAARAVPTLKKPLRPDSLLAAVEGSRAALDALGGPPA
ncbi:MAG: ATP-binding protein [Polyangiales bacterium]